MACGTGQGRSPPFASRSRSSRMASGFSSRRLPSRWCLRRGASGSARRHVLLSCIVVCSDPTAGGRNENEDIRVSELECPVSTDPADIAHALDGRWSDSGRVLHLPLAGTRDRCPGRTWRAAVQPGDCRRGASNDRRGPSTVEAEGARGKVDAWMLLNRRAQKVDLPDVATGTPSRDPHPQTGQSGMVLLEESLRRGLRCRTAADEGGRGSAKHGGSSTRRRPWRSVWTPMCWRTGGGVWPRSLQSRTVKPVMQDRTRAHDPQARREIGRGASNGDDVRKFLAFDRCLRSVDAERTCGRRIPLALFAPCFVLADGAGTALALRPLSAEAGSATGLTRAHIPTIVAR